MSFPLDYRATMTMAAEVARDKTEPGYVRAKVLCALIRELSPLHERHLEVKRELGIEEAPATVWMIDEEAEARAYLKGVRDGLEEAAEIRAAEEEEDDGDEESGGAEEDEPP